MRLFCMAIQSVDPRTGEIRRTYQPLADTEVDRRIDDAVGAFKTWRRTSFQERAACMVRVAELLEAERLPLGHTITLEMGKTLTSAIAEVEKCARACRFYAERAESLLANEVISNGNSCSYVRYLPLGPVFAIMPWNFPFWQVFRFLAPTLMAGNVALLKHASNVPECALAIESLITRAGVPKAVFQSLLIGAAQASRIVPDSRLAAVTLTGSTSAGSAVAGAAGASLKPTLLELGGSDPFIVMPSADLDAAAKVGVASRTLNNGQSCINAKRFIVHRAIYDEFAQRMTVAFDALRVGDPMLPETEIGPLALRSVRDELADIVAQSVDEGATCMTGARSINQPGWWFRPGILESIPESARAFREELFGPVALLFRVDGVEGAIDLANRSPFGLGSSVWTQEAGERQLFIDELEVGQTFVNAMVASDPALPFGGIKASGYGRELGTSGIRAFTNAKTVHIVDAEADT